MFYKNQIMNNSTAAAKQNELFGHPKGLFVLFFTEMWERFSYYGMRGILVLYMATSATAIDPGLGWTNKDAIWLYGWYTMLVYVASIPGGWIADKFLGQKKTVMLGGLLLCFGHGILAIPQSWAFFTGLLLIILGVGGLKPNISTMVGGLYKEGDIRRDSGFTIFYIGINIGAFLASITVGLVAYYYGWHYGFGLAGIGMLLGQLVFFWGQKHLEGVGEFSGGTKASLAEQEATKRPLNKIEKDRIIVLLISFLIVVVFWGAFEQAGGLMNLYTDAKVDRTTGMLSFITKLAPLKYASLMMGIYFAATGFGNKLAGSIGESSQLEPYSGQMVVSKSAITPYMSKSTYEIKTADGISEVEDYPINLDKNFGIKCEVYPNDGSLVFKDIKSGKNVSSLFTFERGEIAEKMKEYNASASNPLHANLSFGKNKDKAQNLDNIGDGKDYEVSFVIEEEQSEQEYNTFKWLVIFTVAFGLLLLVFLKKLKTLTHGAEDREGIEGLEAEGFDLADQEIN